MRFPVLLLLALTSVTFACDSKDESKTEDGPAVTDAQVDAACANLEKILAKDNPDKAKREAAACPKSIRATPGKQAVAFAECLAEAPDEKTFIEKCMPLRK